MNIFCKGNGLVSWYQVIALETSISITMLRFIARPFGVLAVSLPNVSFSAKSKSATAMEVTDSTFGCRADPGGHCRGLGVCFSRTASRHGSKLIWLTTRSSLIANR